MFAAVADRFGWTFDEIAELTYPQMAAIERYIKENPVKYVCMVTPDE